MYKFIQLKGKGNFGAVWKATKGGQLIALKVVGNLDNEELKTTALREVKLLKEISTPKCFPSLACIYDYKLEGNKLYIEMEYIEGSTLKQFSDKYRLIGENKFYKSLVAIILDISRGLQYLHERGIIHRDVKPDNILIDEKDQPKLIDIGLACTTFIKEGVEIVKEGKEEIVKEEKVEKVECKIGEEIVPCCKGKRSAGTPLYMAPETLLYAINYYSSDIFSLGVTIFESATGTLPINTKGLKSVDDLRHRVQHTDYQKLETPNLVLNMLVNNMLIREPLERMTSAEIIEFIES